MGPTQYDGHAGVQAFREAGWEKVSTRKHTVQGIFPSPTKPDEELMLYGLVDYGNKDGSKKDGVEWAGRMTLAKDTDGSLRIRFYKVYFVSPRRSQFRL